MGRRRPTIRSSICRGPGSFACLAWVRFRPASHTGYGAGCCGITPRRRWCRSRCWCRSLAPRRRHLFSAKPSGRCGFPEWSSWSAASQSCCCRSARKPCPSSPECHMSHSLLLAFVVFAVVMFFTPGPNNVMLLSSGLTHGFCRTLPHIAGITIGVAFMVAAVGLGLGTVFIAYPVLQTILKYAGAAYLIYLSAAIAMSGAAPSGQDNRRGPMTFWGAAVFQWINVKGWVMVIGTITAYAAIASFPWNIVIQTAISLVMGTLSTVAWALFGSALRPLLTSPLAVRAFNIVMAALLLASLYPVFMDA